MVDIESLHASKRYLERLQRQNQLGARQTRRLEEIKERIEEAEEERRTKKQKPPEGKEPWRGYKVKSLKEKAKAVFLKSEEQQQQEGYYKEKAQKTYREAYLKAKLEEARKKARKKAKSEAAGGGGLGGMLSNFAQSSKAEIGGALEGAHQFNFGGTTQPPKRKGKRRGKRKNRSYNDDDGFGDLDSQFNNLNI